MAKAPVKIDEEALAEAYNRALALEKAGDLDAAEKAYAQVLALDPEDHGGATVRLAALGRGETPIKAPDAYVETLFDQHAEDFEDILVEQLGYCVPVMIRQKLQEMKLGPFDSMLDLGCGTGLTGGALRDMVNGEMVGLDLSENMVEIAHEKDLYETLYVAECVDYLDDNEDGPFALVTAADVLPYIGALEPLFLAWRKISRMAACLFSRPKRARRKKSVRSATRSGRASGSSILKPMSPTALRRPVSRSSR